MVNRGEEKVRVHMNVVPRSTICVHSATRHNIHNNGRREFTSMWMRGALFSLDTQAILQKESGFPRDCLRGGDVPKLAGLPTPWVKEIFILFFSKHNSGFSHSINVFKKYKYIR